MSFSTYVTTWDTDPLAQISDMIAKNTVNSNTRIILAFASFNFASTSYIPGFGNIGISEVQQITSLVRIMLELVYLLVVQRIHLLVRIYILDQATWHLILIQY